MSSFKSQVVLVFSYVLVSLKLIWSHTSPSWPIEKLILNHSKSSYPPGIFLFLVADLPWSRQAAWSTRGPCLTYWHPPSARGSGNAPVLCGKRHWGGGPRGQHSDVKNWEIYGISVVNSMDKLNGIYLWDFPLSLGWLDSPNGSKWIQMVNLNMMEYVHMVTLQISCWQWLAGLWSIIFWYKKAEWWRGSDSYQPIIGTKTTTFPRPCDGRRHHHPQNDSNWFLDRHTSKHI